MTSNVVGDQIVLSRNFTYRLDRWNGVTVISEKQEYCDDNQFRQKLQSSIAKWISEGLRTVWFHVSLKHSNWIPVLCENNFVFHRANSCGDTVVMYRWLPTDSPSRVPAAAHTMVGVGGIVTNSKSEILIVQEKYLPPDHWKLPGGLVELDEDIAAAGIREVLEETGILTVFKSCILFRHTHRVNFGYSDLYFVVHLQAENEDIKIDNMEISAARWIIAEDFLNHRNIHELNKTFVKSFLDNKDGKGVLVHHTGLHPITNKPFSLYFPSPST